MTFSSAEYLCPDRKVCFEDISFRGELLSWKRMFFRDKCFILRGICGYFPPGFFMRVILRGKWGVFYARIAAAVDSARVLVLISARILFVAGLERDFKCFSARIASAVDSAREMRCFPACRRENAPPAAEKGHKKIAASFLKLRFILVTRQEKFWVF